MGGQLRHSFSEVVIFSWLLTIKKAEENHAPIVQHLPVDPAFVARWLFKWCRGRFRRDQWRGWTTWYWWHVFNRWKSDGSLLKADAIGVTGCSRFGKGAFIAGVLDQRVALPMPIESGTCGVPIWRGISKGQSSPNDSPQSLLSAYSEQPWYSDAFSECTSDPSRAPLDTHALVAMVAPRGLLIMENPEISELGTKYGHVAALGGAEVYRALGAGDNISYHSDISPEERAHCSPKPEWKTPLQQNIRKFLLKTGNEPGAIKPSAKQAGNLSDWSDWTTPTLH
jgi:hypothetical protein